jgi:hypothetical protein
LTWNAGYREIFKSVNFLIIKEIAQNIGDIIQEDELFPGYSTVKCALIAFNLNSYIIYIVGLLENKYG